MKIKNSNSNEKNVRRSVVIPVSNHDTLENYVREFAYKFNIPYTKSDFLRESIEKGLATVEGADFTKTPTGLHFDPAKAPNLEAKFRFSVVVPESVYTRIENFIREYSYKNRVNYTASDFFRDAVITNLEKSKAEEVPNGQA